MPPKGRIDLEEVRREAAGRWVYIHNRLTPALSEALARAPKHVACPFHGGLDDFRMDKDPDAKGGAICTCGAWGDGFGLIMRANGWDFVTTLKAVAEVLGIGTGEGQTRTPPPPAKLARQKTQTAPPRNAANIEAVRATLDKPKTVKGTL